MRPLTAFELQRVELLLVNWALAKAGAPLSSYASTSAYSEITAGRSAQYTTRYPILQRDADLVDAIIYGRPASQLLPAVAPMFSHWREVLELYYIAQMKQAEIARRIRITQQSVSSRLAAARFVIWTAVSEKCDSAETRASA